MAADSGMPELVRDTELEAIFYPSASMPQVTVHRRPWSIYADDTEEWKRVERIDHGGSSTVWLEKPVKGVNALRHGLRVVKELRTNRSLDYTRELEALAKFSQGKYREYFVKFYGWFEAPGTLFIATEYHEHGDLMNHIAEYGPLPEVQAHHITGQILQGLIFMHENHFAHRDIKPANILISLKPPKHKWRVKICDFGLSRKFQGNVRSRTIRGTPGFMPPELISGIGEDVRNADPFLADIWCLGETAFQILTGKGTFDNNVGLLNYWNGHSSFPSEPLKRARVSSRAISFLQSIMTARPLGRLNAKQAIRHRWMAEPLVPGTEATSSQSNPGLSSNGSTRPSAQWPHTPVAYEFPETEPPFVLVQKCFVSSKR
ncbi:kinase-like domain-containing protein [Annulohypoxylon moriforme]|nr:kinase-like domain-containing protein [Annulohypoxylon moriforme]